MSTISRTHFHLPVISTQSIEMGGPFQGGISATGTWPNANQAFFWPLALRSPYLVRKVWWANAATVAGNGDAGVYTEDGVRLFSCGSTAVAGANLIQSVTLGTPYLLEPGAYYMALSMSSATTTVLRTNMVLDRMKMIGFALMNTAFALPATATMTAMTENPPFLCGIASATVI